MINYILIVITE